MTNKKNQKNRPGTFAGVLLIMPLFFLVLVLQSFVQGPEEVPEIKGSVSLATVNKDAEYYDEDVIFTVVEEQPKFPGGEDARMQFIKDNLKYPEMAKEAGIQGTVFVSFVIEKDGSLSNVQVLRGVSNELDAEAVRAVEAMPDWIPGRQRGKEVRVQYNMPIRFSLDEDEDTFTPVPDDDALNLIIIDGERHEIAGKFDIVELNELIPVEEIGHIELLTGKDAEPYGYKRVIMISRKEELKFFRDE